jgi:hypothetical protein
VEGVTVLSATGNISFKTTKGEVMFAIFRKRASKMLAELASLRQKEVALAKRAQTHIAEAHSIIGTLYQEIDDAQLVVDLVEERDIF